MCLLAIGSIRTKALTSPTVSENSIVTEMHSGTFFRLDEPVADQVHLADIAHHLGNICRFGGAPNSFYSVAEHCIKVRKYLQLQDCGPRVQLAGLLHDAHEAYVGDVTTPVKKLLGKKYRDLVDGLDLAIASKFSVTVEQMHSETVKEADLVMLAVEAFYMMPSSGEGPAWDRLPKVDAAVRKLMRPDRYTPKHAKSEFVFHYNQLASQVDGLSVVR